jgi:hypothetical protein
MQKHSSRMFAFQDIEKRCRTLPLAGTNKVDQYCCHNKNQVVVFDQGEFHEPSGKSNKSKNTLL